MTTISGQPTAEEAAAIVAAVAAWTTSASTAGDDLSTPAAWRFSGRWFAGPLAAQRRRPVPAWATRVR